MCFVFCFSGGNPALPAENKEYQALLYFQPWYRLQPYFVGIMVGYIFHRTKGRFDLHWVCLPSFVILSSFDICSQAHFQKF